jgi:1,4-alpha-glucan branching enzyme
MGWMHDTLQYFHHEPVHRSYHQNDLTFGLVYAWSEHFVLPLSHDEVVHGKGSLLARMPGDPWQRFANLRALYGWMWAHPGRKLLFMGGEFAQGGEWSHDQSLDWHLLDEPAHLGVRNLLDDLNRLLQAEVALWADDDGPGGFEWIAADDSASSVLSFLRLDPSGAERPVLCVANLTPVPRQEYRVGVPGGELWQELLCTDDERYGGSGIHASGPGADPGVAVAVASEPVPMHGRQRSVSLTLPPLGVLWLAPS